MILNTLAVFATGFYLIQYGILMYSLTIYLEDGVKDSCSGNFVIFAEKCPWESLRKKVTLCGISLFFD